MAGREKIKVYEYSINGKFIKKYETMTEMFNVHYNGKKRPLFEDKKYNTHLGNCHKLPNGNFLSYEKLGRDKICRINTIANSSISNLRYNENDKEFGLFDLRNRCLAKFNNVTIASTLLNIPNSLIYFSLKRKHKSQKYVNGEIYFKYLEENE